MRRARGGKIEAAAGVEFSEGESSRNLVRKAEAGSPSAVAHTCDVERWDGDCATARSTTI